MKRLLLLSMVGLFCAAYGGAYKGQYGQDRFVNETFFHNKRNGVFVDIGAHDGVTLSNSYFFEKELGWQGLCVEPLPHIFERLLKNRSCMCVQGCVTSYTGPGKLYSVSGYCEMLSGLVNTYDPRHHERIARERETLGKDDENFGGDVQLVEVDCFTLHDLLQKHSLDHIDYLSLDIEGGEFELLSSIDFAAISIAVIDVENNYHDNRIYNLLHHHGYRLVKRIVCDEIYVRDDLV